MYKLTLPYNNDQQHEVPYIIYSGERNCNFPNYGHLPQ